MESAVVVAQILGVPSPDVAVWRSTDDPDVSGDLDDPPANIRRDDVVVIAIERIGFRWIVRSVLEHRPAPAKSSTPGRRPHAHPARPPGTVLIAWFPFTREGDDAPGKHRPCVVVHSSDPAMIRARPLYDAGSAHVRNNGGIQLEGWRAAGLDKASVAVEAVDVPVRHCEQSIGALSPIDRRRLGIDRS